MQGLLHVQEKIYIWHILILGGTCANAINIFHQLQDTTNQAQPGYGISD